MIHEIRDTDKAPDSYVSVNFSGVVTGLFVGCTVGKITVEEATKSTLALWSAMIIVLLPVAFIPRITMFLPDLIR